MKLWLVELNVLFLVVASVLALNHTTLGDPLFQPILAARSDAEMYRHA